MKFENIRVFVCVPGLGKSFLCKKDDRFVDMDEMRAKYKYASEDASEFEIEWAKGNRGEAKRRHSTEFIEQKTKELLENTDKILLFAPTPKIVEMIFKNQIPYCLVYHSRDCLSEVEERMRKRGNQENFIRSMIDSFEIFHKENEEDERPEFKIELGKNEFVSDIFQNPKKFLQRTKCQKNAKDVCFD